jgi:hypothetical protein
MEVMGAITQLVGYLLAEELFFSAEQGDKTFGT